MRCKARLLWFLALPPASTYLPAHLSAAVIFEFDDAGKISKIWNEWDLFSMWTQLGWTEELCGKA